MQPAEITVINLAGVVQGVALVTFPAASTIFTSPAHYRLSSTQYGFTYSPPSRRPSWAAFSPAA